jgi:hypothetical protein
MYDENYYDMCIDIDPIASDYYSGSYYLCYDYLAAMSYVNYDFNGKDRAREIITEVMGIDDIQVRTEMNNELAKICVDNMLWFNLVSPPSALGMSDDLQGTIRNAYNFASLFRNLYWG